LEWNGLENDLEPSNVEWDELTENKQLAQR
jgi:hypothetical protein